MLPLVFVLRSGFLGPSAGMGRHSVNPGTNVRLNTKGHKHALRTDEPGYSVAVPARTNQS